MLVSFGILDFLHVRCTRKFIFRGSIRYREWYLEFLFRHFKVVRLHAILHDAAGATWAFSGTGPGYGYMIGRGPNSYLLGHVTGLLFCLCVKRSPRSIFGSVDFWSSMSCIVLNYEFADENVIKYFGVFLMGMFKDFHFVLKKLQTHKADSLRYRKLASNCVEQWVLG